MPVNAIVFGGAGFIGSHVADALVTAGHHVTVFDRTASPYLTPGQRMIVGDILDFDVVKAATAGQQVAYNFAGMADIDEAIGKPIETVRLNMLGCAYVLEAARLAGVERFVQASTIYVSSEAGGFYRASKQACELWVEECQRQFGLNYTILRYGTVYGNRSDSRNSVYRYLRQALLARKVTVQATGDEMREYVHVRDAAASSVAILADEFRNESVILTGQYPMRFRDLLHMVREIVGSDVVVEFQNPADNAVSRGHYSFTPYSFRPKLGRKLVARSYIDLGQGLIECLEEIHDAEHRAPATGA
jgi:UDP-glucose 4-epimerase